MISAATAATAVLMVTLVRDHGLQYLLAATILAGVHPDRAGFARLGYVMRFVSRSVMTGFVNALAILIFMAQLPELIGRGWQTYAMIAAGARHHLPVPALTKAVPSPLVCIIVLTALSLICDIDVRTVGDMGELPSTLPVFLLPRRAAHARDALDHPALLDRRGRGRPARKPDDGADRRRDDRHAEATRTANASARASPISSPASSAAWRAAR